MTFSLSATSKSIDISVLEKLSTTTFSEPYSVCKKVRKRPTNPSESVP